MEAFSPGEQATLAKQGVVFFAGRVIVEAQPPIGPAQLAAIERQCEGPIPAQLVELWKLTAGGLLYYDLEVTMGARPALVSWQELFFNGSKHYRDLQGWIEHELELAEEAAQARGRAWSGKLSHLPFGGFEYCDRIYAKVTPGPTHGQIVAWREGLPPAWTYAEHEDQVGVVAADLHRAFGELLLHDDPAAPATEYPTSQSMLERLDELVSDGGLEPPLRDKVLAYYRGALADWRTPFEQRRLSQLPRLMRVAFQHALAKDDAAMIEQLAAQQALPAGAVRGSATVLEAALVTKKHRVAEALLAAGVAVPPTAFNALGDDAVEPALISKLIAGGAPPTVKAIVGLAASGADDAARLAAAELGSRQTGLKPAFDAEKKKVLAQLEAQLAERVQRLRRFTLDARSRSV